MTEYPVKNLHGQILILDTVEELHALDIVEKPAYAVPLAECRETGLAKMTIRDMAYVMPERDRLNEILVQPQASPDRPRDFRYELDMDDPVGDVVIFDKVKDLRLVDVSRVCPCMDDAIRIAGVRSADIFCIPVVTAGCIGTGRGKGRKKSFAFICHGANGGIKSLVKGPDHIPFSHVARQFCTVTY